MLLLSRQAPKPPQDQASLFPQRSYSLLLIDHAVYYFNATWASPSTSFRLLLQSHTATVSTPYSLLPKPHSPLSCNAAQTTLMPSKLARLLSQRCELRTAATSTPRGSPRRLLRLRRARRKSQRSAAFPHPTDAGTHREIRCRPASIPGDGRR